MKIYVQRGNQRIGPITIEEARRGLEYRTLDSGDLAWQEGTTEWVHLGALPGLYPEGMRPPGDATSGSGPQSSGVAVASLCLGVLSLCGCLCVTGIPAVICGHIALVDVKRSQGLLRGKRIAVAGLITGYLGLALLGLIPLGLKRHGKFGSFQFSGPGMVLPQLAPFQSTMPQRAVAAEAKAKELALACDRYATEHDGRLPGTLEELIPTYVADAAGLIAPAENDLPESGFYYFGAGHSKEDAAVSEIVASKREFNGQQVVGYLDGSVSLRTPQPPPAGGAGS